MYRAAGDQAAQADQMAGETDDVDSIRIFADKYGIKTGGKAGLELLQKGLTKLGTVAQGGEYLAKQGGRLAKNLAARVRPGGGDVPSSADVPSTNAAPRAPAVDEDEEGFDADDMAEFRGLMAQKQRIYGPRVGQEPIEDSAGLGAAEVQAPFDEEAAATRLEQETENIKGLKPEDFQLKPPPQPHADVEDVTDTGAGGGDESALAKIGEPSGADLADDAAGAAEKAAEKAAADAAEAAGKSAFVEGATKLGTTLAEGLGQAIPIIGLGADLYTAVSTGMDIAKDFQEHPFEQAQKQIQHANTQIGAMESQVSTDQFQSRIGAAMPSFGSLAAAGQRAGQSIALHD